ncbi:hypothetical protein B4U79_06998 [Dinothrombium tinctorium]|uniref:Copper transport protein n=1 Tax=Dinothrombium tinctorium TaxID=1965070 RepID=A0A3S5WGS1_9ACAR|nr:hypothetical protein B4U79_06998 [Dinothrombium tinctorium]
MSHHHGAHDDHASYHTVTPTSGGVSNHGSDHSSHPMPMMVHHMMKMYFHTDFGDTLFFENWVLNNAWQTIVACLLLFILAALYEGLKSYREYLYRQRKQAPCYPVSVLQFESANGTGDQTTNTSGCANAGGCGDGSTFRRQSSLYAANRIFYKRMLNSHHIVQSLLHVLQVAVSYTLMLAFMTFNIWICLAILAGAGLGYFLFCWRRFNSVDITEHCN